MWTFALENIRGYKDITTSKTWNQDYSSMRGIASPYMRYCS